MKPVSWFSSSPFNPDFRAMCCFVYFEDSLQSSSVYRVGLVLTAGSLVVK